MRVLLVDDEPLALEKLQVFFRDIPDTEVVGAARDGIEAAAEIARLQPDLVILDIQMPGRSGLAVAADLAAEDRPEIVFVTAFEHFAPDAFDVDAADYLLKPVRLERLRRAVARARRRRELASLAATQPEPADEPAAPEPAAASAKGYVQTLSVPGATGTLRVAVAAIDWIEAAKDYVILHTCTRSHMVRATMAMLEESLDPSVMLRVHRSTFVRREAVAEVQRPSGGGVQLRLADGTAVPVGPSYVRSVLDRLGGR